MQVTTTNDDEVLFKPFEITITVESEDDLKTLWHRFNITMGNVMSRSHEDSMLFPLTWVETREIWQALDTVAINRRMKKS